MSIVISSAVQIDNTIWFTLYEYKFLVSLDVESKEKKYYKIPSGESCALQGAFSMIKTVGRKIYLIPCNEKVIMQFDIDTEEFCEIKIDNRFTEYQKNLFYGAAVYQNYIFILGGNAPVIIRLDTDNNHIDYITDWKEKTSYFGSMYFSRHYVVLDNKLYAPFMNANAVLVLDCVTLETSIHSMGTEEKGYACICYEDSCFWLAPLRHDTVVKWNIETKQVCEFQISNKDEQGKNSVSYAGITIFDNKKILLSYNGKQHKEHDKNIVQLLGCYSFLQEDEKHIIFYEKTEGIMTLINKENHKRLQISIGGCEGALEYLVKEKGCIVEKSGMGLRSLMKYMAEL